MARQTREQALSSDTGWYEGRLLATVVSGENPDGTTFFLPTESFEEYAARNGYIRDAYSGETPISATTDTTLLDLTVPAGETWYRRQGLYSVVGGRVGRFRRYRQNVGGVETLRNTILSEPNTSDEFSSFEKYNAGDRMRFVLVANALAAAGDVASCHIQYIALPYVE